MAVYLVTSLPKIPFIHRIYMVLANPTCNGCALLSWAHPLHCPTIHQTAVRTSSCWNMSNSSPNGCLHVLVLEHIPTGCEPLHDGQVVCSLFHWTYTGLSQPFFPPPKLAVPHQLLAYHSTEPTHTYTGYKRALPTLLSRFPHPHVLRLPPLQHAPLITSLPPQFPAFPARCVSLQTPLQLPVFRARAVPYACCVYMI
jgi:hypothetical protein